MTNAGRSGNRPRGGQQAWIGVLALTTVSIIILMWHGTPFAEVALSDRQIVDQFFPQLLIDDAAADFAAGGPEPSRFADYVLADLDKTGRNDFIVAAYSNGFRGAVRVLRKQGGGAVLVAEPQMLSIAGIVPRLRLVDVNADGRPEVLVTFASAQGLAAQWLFTWAGTALSLIGPVALDERGLSSTTMVGGDLLDLDGDGVLEIVVPGEFAEVPQDTGTFLVYRFDGTRYAASNVLNVFQTVVRGTAAPVSVSRDFEVGSPGDQYKLSLVNGDPKGKNRVSSGTVRLNGVVIMGPERFKQKTPVLIQSVTLQTVNTLAIELASAPGATVTVSVGRQVQ
jgi:hypothetical protein